MLKSRPVRVAFQPEAKVTALCLSSCGTISSWAEGDGKVFIAQVKSGNFELCGSWIAESFIRKLIVADQSILVLDDAYGLTRLDLKGNVLWQFAIEAGGFELHQLPSFFAVVDGLGRLSMIHPDGTNFSNDEQFFDIVLSSVVGEYLLLSQENGQVHVIQNGIRVWSRPARGEQGESITCLGGYSGQHLVIGREGYAMVAGEEEVLEVEFWDIKNQQLIHRCDVKSRLLTVESFENKILCGFDSGQVLCFDEHFVNQPQVWMECKYPISNLFYRGGKALASAWFYIHGREEDGETWLIEHQGITQYLSVSDDGSVCLFAGEDQNDWTEHEPIGQFSLDQSPIEVDESELTLWFEKTDEVVPLSAEELYSEDDSMSEYFTQAELDSITETSTPDVSLSVLQDALEGVQGEIAPSKKDGTLDIDTDELLSQLDDAIEKMAILPDENLLDELNVQIDELIVPRAVSGDDQHHAVGQDGSVIITLDGSGSFDPQERIKTWSWIEQSGKEIASSSKVKVRLSPGNYRFELRVCDLDGQWSSDSLQVLIDEG